MGTFAPRDIRRGGTLRWDSRELMLRPVSSLRERDLLREGDRELVLVEGKGWGRRPVTLTLAEPDAIDSGLLLFAAFVVNRLAVNAGSSAGSTAAVTATAG